ncbi:hypothetical protein FOCC_FOCC000965 [Frankliniella occidentalis]|nr:hypothetical protein FOCC_FOCC000965 [Frankliniella occidentalis]
MMGWFVLLVAAGGPRLLRVQHHFKLSTLLLFQFQAVVPVPLRSAGGHRGRQDTRTIPTPAMEVCFQHERCFRCLPLKQPGQPMRRVSGSTTAVKSHLNIAAQPDGSHPT